ncbi:MAG: hypothetical protein JRI89_16075 [Deltaproteobacteria bacterium]|nr:hypothetical protein [Deltaproteobacteria bacterium]
MQRKQIDYSQPVEVTLNSHEKSLILEHTFVGPDLTDQFELASEKEGKIIVKYTLDELEELLGFIAAEANHTEDSRLQKELDELYDRLQTEMEP